MRLVDYLDKGASLGGDAKCLTMGAVDRSYGEVQEFTHRFARALQRSGIGPGSHVAILSSNDATAFECVLGISRAGAVWCPINPRNQAAENRDLLDRFDCTALVFHSSFEPLVSQIRADLPRLSLLVCLDRSTPFANSLDDWLGDDRAVTFDVEPLDDLALIVGTGGTTGLPKGVMLSGHNIETMSSLTLMSYPFGGRPVYLALAPLTHAAGVLCFPIMALGGQVVVMPKPDLDEFLALIARHRVTHTFLPPTVIYMLLDHPALAGTDVSSLQCFWYGAAPISSSRLEEALSKIGPVMAQLFGQSEAPMMVSTMAPADHFDADGSVARRRLSSAGRPTPLVTIGIMDDDGGLLPAGERGEIVVRGPLVMMGYYHDAAATADASKYGWHHTGDIGYLDDDNFLYIVDRAKDMIITGGFNVFSAEVEQALLQHPDVQDCGVVGLPDDKWGERVCAVVQPLLGRRVDPNEIAAFVKEQLGSVKAPKQIEVWTDLPRSTVGKVLKTEIRAKLLEADQASTGPSRPKDHGSTPSRNG